MLYTMGWSRDHVVRRFDCTELPSDGDTSHRRTEMVPGVMVEGHDNSRQNF